MENVGESIGIDVSKRTLDVYLHQKQLHQQFSNDESGYKQILSWTKLRGIQLDQALICFEHTGWYCLHLSYYLNLKGVRYCCINPMEIKRSIGLKRGKTDKADSKEIARYAWLHREELIESTPPPRKLIELQCMMSYREQLAKQLRSLKVTFFNSGKVYSFRQCTIGVIKETTFTIRIGYDYTLIVV